MRLWMYLGLWFSKHRYLCIYCLVSFSCLLGNNSVGLEVGGDCDM